MVDSLKVLCMLASWMVSAGAGQAPTLINSRSHVNTPNSVLEPFRQGETKLGLKNSPPQKKKHLNEIVSSCFKVSNGFKIYSVI